MKLISSTFALLLIITAFTPSVISQTTAVNNCTPGACNQCRVDDNKNNNRYCTECSRMPVVGTGINQRCEEDKTRQIPGCIQYVSDEHGNSECNKCDGENYYLASSTCVLYILANKVKHCHTKHPELDDCLVCDSGYTIYVVSDDVTSWCVKNTENCIEMMQGSASCKKCHPGYSIVKGMCTRNTIENCATQDFEREVSRCTEYSLYYNAERRMCQN